MTQGKAIQAYFTLFALKGVKGSTAFTVYKLKNELKKIVDFQSEEEKKIIEKHGGTISESGKVTLPEKADAKTYEQEMNELHNIECDLEPVEIAIDNLPEITVPQIEALDGIIKFVER